MQSGGSLLDSRSNEKNEEECGWYRMQSGGSTCEL
jgi:hypothetical protein